VKPPFKFSWEEVTPAKAASWLKKNRNRHLRKTTVTSFAADMVNGAWSPSHQGIAFDLNGNLIDGQHRLAAIVKSGVSLWFLVCRDVPVRVDGVKANVMDVLDRGNSRSIADVLKLSHGQTANQNIIAATCAMIPRILLGQSERTHKITLAQTLAILNRYKASLKFVAENRPPTIALRAAPICAAVAIAHAVEPKKSEEFYRQFSTGVGIDATSPILAIRNHCINIPPGRGGSHSARAWQAMLVLHSIYAFIKKLKVDRFPREDSGTEFGKWFIDQQPENVAALDKVFPRA
jgi:hypothetical protein